MNIKPIHFPTHMVRAILQGQKTLFCVPITDIFQNTYDYDAFTGKFTCGVGSSNGTHGSANYTRTPGYSIGDILRVREIWTKHDGNYYYKASIDPALLPYLESEKESWHPASNMPKAASRIFLRVTGFYAEQLQDFDEDGVKHAGAEFLPCGKHQTLVDRYRNELWDNYWKPRGKHTWKSNPWVWVYTFERIDKPEEWED